jgi:murein DD-endopeptidase MepM/ murein hydrolase activator NlpD
MVSKQDLTKAQDTKSGLNAEVPQQLGFFDRMKQNISREGGIWGAMKSALNEMGPEMTGLTEGAGKSLGTGTLIWPGGDVITSPFGPRKTGLKGASTMHRGVDMRAESVVAAAPGVVSDINTKWGGITIDHGNGLHTRYLHLRGFAVKKGDQIQAGQTIGLAGNTGPIPGMKKHLHFEVMNQGRKIDPELVYNAAGKFSPKYAPDIVPERQLSAKLGNKPIDPSKLKDEGAEAAGPFGFDMYDPIEAMGSLQKKIHDIGKERTRKEEVAEYATPSAPMVVPFPTQASDSSMDNLNKSKDITPIDPDLDAFVSNLFTDASHEFSSRYKKYAYHSNMGHSFT